MYQTSEFVPGCSQLRELYYLNRQKYLSELVCFDLKFPESAFPLNLD